MIPLSDDRPFGLKHEARRHLPPTAYISCGQNHSGFFSKPKKTRPMQSLFMRIIERPAALVKAGKDAECCHLGAGNNVALPNRRLGPGCTHP
jgi:hypothetical protein